MKVYVVVEVNGVKTPKLIGVYSSRDKANEVAYKDADAWRNVIEKQLDK